MDAEAIKQIRDILKGGWGSYDSHYNQNAEWVGSWFTRLDVDKLTDAEVLEIAEAIANQPKRQ